MAQNQSSFIVSKIKVILLGDATVGKTSIISAIRQLDFQQKQQPTIGIDFFAKIVTKNDKSYKLQFWDTAGQQRFRSIIPSYIRNANVGLIVFDTQNRASYESISNWLEIFRENSPQFSQIIVIGNKIDREGRQVSKQEAQAKFTRQNITYIEVSAKKLANIDKLTQLLIERIDSSSGDIKQQEQRVKSYAKLYKIMDQIPISVAKQRKCCGI